MCWHLKMCSKSLVFVPKNCDLPMTKIAYKNCNRIYIWPGKLNGKESNVLALSCSQYTEMLSKNIVAPYTFRNESRTFLFNFHYARAYEYLDQLRQLHRASKLHACEQNDMVNQNYNRFCCRSSPSSKVILISIFYLKKYFLRLQLLCTQDINVLNSIHFGWMTSMKPF